ncbi:MAG: sulfatase-like hydrolase/transferase [Candidatus Latescibacteria bacterium]|nr:sulfatase-like hydrolase/transferase [Candidatus Latescibacterota bacterium]
MDQPHIVLIMADQLRWDCLSCYGDHPVQTPNLDALAGESAVFNRAYCAAPLCTPTRTSMFTGKWPHTHGAIVNGHAYEPEMPYGTAGPDHRTDYEILGEAGYQLTHVGVQHLRLDPTLEERVPAADITYNKEYAAYCRQNGIARNPQNQQLTVPNMEWSGGRPIVSMRPQARVTQFPHPAEDWMDMFWSRVAAEKIAAMDPDQPQYLKVLFWAPHPPLEVAEPYFSMYPPESIDMPPTVGQWCPGQPASLLAQSCGQMGLGQLREEYRDGWSAYFGMVTMIDDCVGRVVNALKDKGLWDDALVIFTSDHGEMLGCHHLMQKHCCYEEAARLPLLVKPPGGASGTRPQLVSAIDYTPTVCDYAGLEPPPGAQGQSYRTAVEDPEAPLDRRHLYRLQRRPGPQPNTHARHGCPIRWTDVEIYLHSRRYRRIVQSGRRPHGNRIAQPES